MLPNPSSELSSLHHCPPPNLWNPECSICSAYWIMICFTEIWFLSSFFSSPTFGLYIYNIVRLRQDEHWPTDLSWFGEMFTLSLSLCWWLFSLSLSLSWWLSLSLPWLFKPHPVFLHRDVGKVHKHVVQFTDAGIVPHSAEPTEPQPVSVEDKGTPLL